METYVSLHCAWEHQVNLAAVVVVIHAFLKYYGCGIGQQPELLNVAGTDISRHVPEVAGLCVVLHADELCKEGSIHHSEEEDKLIVNEPVIAEGAVVLACQCPA